MSQNPNSNLSAWRYFHKDNNSPDSFINMGFYFMISAALQRRVWLGSEEKPLWPNQYIILVAEPGIGKGMVIGPLKEVIKAHKINRETGKIERTGVVMTPEKIAEMQQENGEEITTERKAKTKEPPLVIPLGADCTTFEKIVQKHSSSIRRINPSKESKFTVNGIYTHSSLCLILPEMETFFHKKSEQLISYLTHCWDCESFDYETKHHGDDHLRNSCLNLIAGTTPTFMEKSLDVQLIAGGFASRSLFVFEHSNRSNSFKEFKFDKSQLEALEQVTTHIGKLTKLFGQVEYTPEAWEVLRHHFEEVDPYTRPNVSLKLNHYYARKRVHAQKMAMAIHFAESTTMTIGVSECEQALLMLEALEQKMHFALAYKSTSPLSAAAKRLKGILHNVGKLTLPDAFIATEGDFIEVQLTEAFRYLVMANEAECYTDKGVRYWISTRKQKKVVVPLEKPPEKPPVERPMNIIERLAREHNIELLPKPPIEGEAQNG